MEILKKIGRQMMLIFLVILCLWCIAAAEDLPVRVGIYYGDNALPTANLANETGVGYELGYHDKDGQFVSLYKLANEKITICKDANLYLYSGNFYETSTNDQAIRIGAFHLQLPIVYGTMEEAAEAAKDYPAGFVAYTQDGYRVRFKSYSTADLASADMASYADTAVVGCSTTCYTVVNTTNGEILFELDSGGEYCLAVSPDLTGCEAPDTWFKGNLYRGRFEYNRRLGNDITVINVVSEDDYLCGVLPCEFVISGDIESLKAAAVAARTFCRQSAKHKFLGFDVCTSTDCQVYHGVYRRDYADKVKEAVLSTGHQMLFYNEKLIQAVYHASSGGKLESAYNTWQYAYPYLIAQEDPYEQSIDFNSKSWSYLITAEQITELLEGKGQHLDEIRNLEVTKRTEIGNVDQIVITDKNGKTVKYNHDNVRALSGIEGITYFSRNFSITPKYEDSDFISVIEPVTILSAQGTTEENTISVLSAYGTNSLESSKLSVLTSEGKKTVNGEDNRIVREGSVPIGWTVAGSGYGHNVGMSQWGANAMAAQGKTYEEILAFYYPGSYIKE